MKVVSPALRLFDETPIDRCIKRLEYIEIHPRDPDTNQDRVIIETKDSDQLLWFHKAVLEVRGRVVQANDNDYAGGTQVALVNVGWSLFRTIQLKVNDETVEELAEFAPVATNILQLVTAGDDRERSSTTNSFWYRDTGTGPVDSAEFVTGATALPSATVCNA